MESIQEIKEILSPEKTVLLIWDVQNSLVNSIFNPEEFLSSTKKLIASARSKGITVIFSKSIPLSDKFESPVRKYLRNKRRLNIKQTPNGLDLTIEPMEGDIQVLLQNTA